MVPIIDDLRAFAADLVNDKGETMKRWDEIRHQVETRKGSDLPRLNFEGLMESIAEKIEWAADELAKSEQLHRECESALLTWDDDLNSLYWTNHPDRAPDGGR